MRQKSSCKTGFCWQYMRLVKDLGLAEETKATCRVVLCHMLLIRLLGDGVHTGMWLYLSSLFPSSVMRRYVLTISFLGLSIHWEIVPISIAVSSLGKVGYIFSEAGLWRIQEAYSPTFFSPFFVYMVSFTHWNESFLYSCYPCVVALVFLPLTISCLRVCR